MWKNSSNLLVKGSPMIPRSVGGVESSPQRRLLFFLVLLGVSAVSVLLFLRWLSQDRNLTFFSQQVIVDTLLHLLVLAGTFPPLLPHVPSSFDTLSDCEVGAIVVIRPCE